ncbi:MAG: tetratricopeptide repeat protein [bacterium]|nr:tetratricopeptide repeat protein [bacterium]
MEDIFTQRRLLKISQEIHCNNGIYFFKKGKLNESKQWLMRALKVAVYTESVSASYIYLGEIEETLNSGRSDYYYKKGIEVLKKREKKSHLETYRLASLYKKTKQYKEAIRLFKQLTRRYPLYTLLAGAFFHLGELYLFEKKKEAKEMFEKCLSVMPEHSKAKEYLEELKRKCAE